MRTSINVLPPYTVYLADYVAPASNKINVSIILNDPNPEELLAKLKFTILGDGISLETKPSFMPNPIRIASGLNAISTAELAPYFEPNNLNISGLDKAQFLRSGKLPEGIYQFCVELVEYNRNIKLSERSCATAWLMLNNPPIWNYPSNNETVKAVNPQNILFSWSPQHTGSPNAAFSTEYEFTLVEIWPSNRNPNDAINAQAPLLRTSTLANSLLLGPADVALIPGRKYAARIRAYDQEGKDLFVNKGYSDVLAFTYGEPCKAPDLAQAKALNYRSAQLSWEGNDNHTAFKIQYQPSNTSANDIWYSKKSFINTLYLDSLQAHPSYRYQIKALCESLESEWSSIYSFSLPPAPVNTFECKDENSPKITVSKSLKASLKVGETINIGGYDVVLTEVSGADGKFSGTGVVVVPMMNNIKLNTQFANITVDSLNRVSEGQIHVTQGGVQLFNDKVREQTRSLVNTLQQSNDALNNYIHKADEILDVTSQLIDKIPESQKKVLEQGKQLIESGKQMLNAGNTEQGVELIEKGKQLIRDELPKIKELKDKINTEIDKLKELFAEVLKGKREVLEKDSSNQQTLLKTNNQKFETLKKEFETYSYTTTEEDKANLEYTDLEDEPESAYETNGLNKRFGIFNTELHQSLNSFSRQRLNDEKTFENVLKKLAWIGQYQVNAPDLNKLIDDFKNEASSLLKKYALDKLNNKESEDLKKQIGIYLEKKLNEIIIKKG